jgi:hypothetical protein
MPNLNLPTMVTWSTCFCGPNRLGAIGCGEGNTAWTDPNRVNFMVNLPIAGCFVEKLPVCKMTYNLPAM